MRISLSLSLNLSLCSAPPKFKLRLSSTRTPTMPERLSPPPRPLTTPPTSLTPPPTYRESYVLEDRLHTSANNSTSYIAHCTPFTEISRPRPLNPRVRGGRGVRRSARNFSGAFGVLGGTFFWLGARPESRPS